TLVGELRNGKIHEYQIEPEDYGLTMASSRNLRVENAAQSRATLLDVLAGKPGVARDIVLLNAGTALYAANVADSIEAGLTLATEAIDSGAAEDKMHVFVAATQRLADG